MTDKKIKLIRIRKKENWGAVGNLYELAKRTQDPELIKQINRILTKSHENKKTHTKP